MPKYEIKFKFTMHCKTTVKANSVEEAKSKIKIGSEDWDGWSPDQIVNSSENQILSVQKLPEQNPIEYEVEYDCTPYATVAIEADSVEEAIRLFKQDKDETGDEYDCEPYKVIKVTPINKEN